MYPSIKLTDVDRSWADALKERDWNQCPYFDPAIDPYGTNCYRGHLCERGFWRLYPKSWYVGLVVRRYDFLTMSYVGLHGGNPRCDVKGRGIKGAPRPNYWVNVVAADSFRGKGYVYSFAFVNEEWGQVWLVGWMPHDEYLERAILLKKGDLQPDNPKNPDFRIKSDRYSMQIKDLRSY